MRILRRLLLGLLALAVLGITGVWLGFSWHPDLARFERYRLPVVPAPAAEASPATAGAQARTGALRVTWLGVSTLLFDDGETAWLTDGFFSRPGLLRVGFGEVVPDEAAITAALARAGVRRLAAVVPLHSHYDHAMDAPVVARLTGARFVGSESSANVARGQGLPEAQITVLSDEGGTLALGRFALRFVASVHAPEDHFPGRIDAPLVPPSRASAYKTGPAYSLLVEHAGRTLLVQSSAGFVPDALAGVRAETVLLGIGLLGKQPEAFRDAYWREVVEAVGARRVVPIHWDDFFQPLDDAPVQPLPWLADRIPTSLAFVERRAQAEQRRWALPATFVAFDPFW